MGITIITFLFFTFLVAFLTWVMTRKADHHTGVGFFLAGRSLTFPFIAGSLLLTNLSTEQLVGLNGDAYKYGLCVMVWEVLAVVALVAMALFFLPRFLKSGIATVPEYLEQRFDNSTQVIANLIFLLAYVFLLLPMILYTGASALLEILNFEKLTGISDRMTLLFLVVCLVAFIGSVYALWGGLKSVAVSDTLNGVGLYVGGLLVTFFALKYLGGGDFFAGWDLLPEKLPPYATNSIGGPQSNVPFDTIFTGILIINLFYWCTNQQIIQRTFGASSLAEGQKGVLLTGVGKLVGPLFLVLPGIIAFAVLNDTSIQSSEVYGKLVTLVLPGWLSGFFAAALLGAILSSFNSALNSTCTLFSLGIYRKFINTNASDFQLVRSGRWLGIVLTIISALIAPLLDGQDSIFGYLQNMNTIYFIPIFSVVLIGMLTKRVPTIAANIALILGCCIIAIGNFVPACKVWVDSLNNYHFVAIVFVFLLLMMLVIGLIAPRKEAYVQFDAHAVDMKPWKFAVPAGIGLLLVVVAIYWFFADFSVLSDDAAQSSLTSPEMLSDAVPGINN